MGSGRTLSDVAAELYGLPAADFTAARNRAADSAAADGGKGQAKQIRSFRKPSVAAWVVNMMVRHRPDLLVEVGELGDELRAAQAALDRDELRTLGKRRQELLRSFQAESASVSSELGQNASASVLSEVGETIQAAIVDEGALAAARSGFLVRSLRFSGLDRVDVSQAAALETGAAVPHAATPEDDERSRMLAKLRMRLDDSNARLTKASAALQHARDTAVAVLADRERLDEEIATLNLRLDGLKQQLKTLERRAKECTQTIESAEGEAGKASARRDADQQALDDARRADNTRRTPDAQHMRS